MVFLVHILIGNLGIGQSSGDSNKTCLYERKTNGLLRDD